MKKLAVIAVIIVGLCVGVFVFNYIKLQVPLNEAIKGNPANQGIDMRAHYGHYVNTSKIIFDVKRLPDGKNSSDVFRILIQLSNQMHLDRTPHTEILYQGHRSLDKIQPQLGLQSKINSVIEQDQRNSGVRVYGYYADLSVPSTLIYDLQDVSLQNSMADVFRVFLQCAEKLQDRVLLVTSLDLSHELPADLFRHPARSPNGHALVYGSIAVSGS